MSAQRQLCNHEHQLAKLSSISQSSHLAGTMILGDISGNIDRSDNYGSAFYGCYCNTEIRNAGDVPWIGPQSPYLSAGNMAFDTQVSNKLWFAEGFAIWYTTPPASSAQLTWTPLTQNNNELIANIVLKPPGLIDHRDLCRSNNKWSNLRPATHGQNNRNRPAHRHSSTGIERRDVREAKRQISRADYAQ